MKAKAQRMQDKHVSFLGHPELKASNPQTEGASLTVSPSS